MVDDDPRWGFAAAFLAYQLRGECGFNCGDTIDFREPIAPGSRMSAFLVVHPRLLASADTELDIGARMVSIRQLLPLHDEERRWLVEGAADAELLRRFSDDAFMNPGRPGPPLDWPVTPDIERLRKRFDALSDVADALELELVDDCHGAEPSDIGRRRRDGGHERRPARSDALTIV